tara:strand:+ start:464 stop:628 length:165 start_codon:yes stop_codon:yes gene_type:complete
MTYRDLLEQLITLTPEQLGQDVSIHTTEADEFTPVDGLGVAVDDGTDVDRIVLY